MDVEQETGIIVRSSWEVAFSEPNIRRRHAHSVCHQKHRSGNVSDIEFVACESFSLFESSESVFTRRRSESGQISVLDEGRVDGVSDDEAGDENV